MANYELVDLQTKDVIDKRTLSWSEAEALNKSAVEKGEKWVRVGSSKAPPVKSSVVSSTPTPIVGTVSTKEQKETGRVADPDGPEKLPSQEDAVTKRIREVEEKYLAAQAELAKTQHTVAPDTKLSDALSNLTGGAIEKDPT